MPDIFHLLHSYNTSRWFPYQETAIFSLQIFSHFLIHTRSNLTNRLPRFDTIFPYI